MTFDMAAGDVVILPPRMCTVHTWEESDILQAALYVNVYHTTF
jgi:hypothetical protein